MKIKKQALLVGGLGGLGSATTKLLSQNGWHVFAADNKQDILGRFEHTNKSLRRLPVWMPLYMWPEFLK
jgi:NAD(P)-dependent dehydrogenase (short-subunit alcohol dehydrogenase family)